MQKPTRQQVHIWSTKVEDCSYALDSLLVLLNKEEQLRAKKLREPLCFVLARAGLRCLLAEYLACEPLDVEFEYGEHGKPFVESPNPVILSEQSESKDLKARSLDDARDDISLHFNLSHTNQQIIWAFAQSELGVDIEKVSPSRDILAIAKRFFSPKEIKQIDTQPKEEQERFAFQLWCAKEALLKAMGKGIVHGLDSFTLEINNDQINLLDDNDSFVHEQQWCILPLKINELNHLSALAVAGFEADINYHQSNLLFSLIDKKINR